MDVLRKIRALPPQPRFDITHWADYVEFLCLIRNDRTISVGEAVDWFKEMTRDVPESESERDDVSNADVDDNPSKSNDKWETRVRDIFALLYYRKTLYGSLYPFRLTGSGNILTRKAHISSKQRIYAFLLICSSLRLVGHKGSGDFTSGFELLSLFALKKVLPPYAEVHFFGGANTINKGDRRVKYKGTLYEKICQLATDLNSEVRIKPAGLPPTSNQDGGLDLVAWLPTGDLLPTLLTFFGQCACSPDEWRAKSASSSAARWEGFLRLPCPPTNNVFIPHCMRNSQGAWHKEHEIHYMLFDRSRLMNLVANDFSTLSPILPMTAVNSVLDLRISSFA